MSYRKRVVPLIFFLISFLFTYDLIDSTFTSEIIYSKQEIESIISSNQPSDLIPDYSNIYDKFEMKILKRRRNIFYSLDFGTVGNAYRFNFTPFFNFKIFQLRLNLDGFIVEGSDNEYNKWSNIYDIMEKIDLFNTNLLDTRLNIFLGKIENLSFGYGYLLSNYGNNYNYPIDKSLGFSLRYISPNRSISYRTFISNIHELIDGGGLIGNHMSIFFSDFFPLTIGFGHISDFNQLYKFQDIISEPREIHAIECDIKYELFDSFLSSINLIGEMVAISYPEKRYYVRRDDDQFSNDKKSRNGSWGIAFPAIELKFKYLVWQLFYNHNSAIFIPNYFNKTYDFEKIRFRNYDILNNEEYFQDEMEILMSYGLNDNSSILVPKDLYGMINGYENTYPTYGFSSNLKYSLQNIFLNLSFSYLIENTDLNPLEYSSLSFDLILDDYFIPFITNFRLFFSKSFFNSFDIDIQDENVLYGANFTIKLHKYISLTGEITDRFYDQNMDGSVDHNSYYNVGLKLEY